MIAGILTAFSAHLSLNLREHPREYLDVVVSADFWFGLSLNRCVILDKLLTCELHVICTIVLMVCTLGKFDHVYKVLKTESDR